VLEDNAILAASRGSTGSAGVATASALRDRHEGGGTVIVFHDLVFLIRPGGSSATVNNLGYTLFELAAGWIVALAVVLISRTASDHGNVK
jgi:hypothetical protein